MLRLSAEISRFLCFYRLQHGCLFFCDSKVERYRGYCLKCDVKVFGVGESGTVSVVLLGMLQQAVSSDPSCNWNAGFFSVCRDGVTAFGN